MEKNKKVTLNACGIVAEYNPFHNGHAYQIKELKGRLGIDLIVVVMSGDFLQRGEPAIVDKWSRAEAAIRSGADVVIEMPLEYSVQSSDVFAEGAIDLLHSLAVKCYSFGAESGDSFDFMKTAKVFLEREEEVDHLFLKQKNNGLSYPAQMEKVMKEIFPQSPIDFSLPNNQLGIAYEKINQAYSAPMKPIVIRRKGANYHAQNISDATIASATAIRKLILSNPVDSIEKYVPQPMFKLLGNSEYVDWNKLWPLLRYQIHLQSVEQLREVYEVREGIEYRLKEKLLLAESFEEYMNLVKTKRYTRTRIQRIFVYILLQWTKDGIAEKLKNEASGRILGFSEIGRTYLGQIKKRGQSTLITNLNRNNQEKWAYNHVASHLHSFLSSSDYKNNNEFQKKPIYIK
ncbi:nucleotidyltransferase [Lacticigenium naphthae]|uniref:nucleotidyltransferase n=1 Tax=Lacticigenium naphthae TaxID=515351 RepID=UPI0003FAFDF8|nr:nucleotidyltransferase [Lacticigenium naphthae]